MDCDKPNLWDFLRTSKMPKLDVNSIHKNPSESDPTVLFPSCDPENPNLGPDGKYGPITRSILLNSCF